MHWRALQHALLFCSLSLPLGLSAACTTSADSSSREAANAPLDADGTSASPTTAAAPGPAAQQAAPTPGECPPAVERCQGDYDPVMCTAAAHAGQALAEAERITAWGTNTCLAKARLAREACAHNRSPALLGQVSCVPDTSAGACPPEPAICTMEFVLSTCSALAYDGQDLTSASAPTATGNNACRARAGLLLAACRRNLNPRLLEKIECRPSP